MENPPERRRRSSKCYRRRSESSCGNSVIMHYRTLGHSGLKLSVIGLGSWLTFGGTVDRDTARACVLRAWELGVNFIDTPNIYARRAAEDVLRPILKELNLQAL